MALSKYNYEFCYNNWPWQVNYQQLMCLQCPIDFPDLTLKFPYHPISWGYARKHGPNKIGLGFNTLARWTGRTEDLYCTNSQIPRYIYLCHNFVPKPCLFTSSNLITRDCLGFFLMQVIIIQPSAWVDATTFWYKR